MKFLNFAGYYRSLIKSFAAIADPLTKLTRGIRVAQSAAGKRGSTKAALKQVTEKWIWAERQLTAFRTIKQALSSFPVLRAPDFSLPFIVKTDAARSGLGATLSQRFLYEHPESGKMVTRTHPIALASRATKGSERNYSAFLLELVAVKWALDKFEKYLYGQPIELVVNCIALGGILRNKKVAPHHARWREAILGHNIVSFTHQPG